MHQTMTYSGIPRNPGGGQNGDRTSKKTGRGGGLPKIEAGDHFLCVCGGGGGYSSPGAPYPVCHCRHTHSLFTLQGNPRKKKSVCMAHPGYSICYNGRQLDYTGPLCIIFNINVTLLFNSIYHDNLTSQPIRIKYSMAVTIQKQSCQLWLPGI